MESQGTILNWVKFSTIMLDSIKELQFMGEIYTEKKNMQESHF